MSEETGSGSVSIGRRVAAGAAWLTALRVSDKLIDVISLVILARLLTPADFGVVALGTSIAAAVGLLQQTGFGSALIQNQTASRDHYDSAWTIQVALSLVSGVALFLGAGMAAASFGDPDLEIVIQVAAAVMILDGFGNIALVDLQKEMLFRKEVAIRFAKLLIAKVTVVATAFYFLDYRALIVGMLVGSVVGLVVGYAAIPYKPRFTWSRGKELFSFSVWLQISTFLAYINRHAQNFVVATVKGTTEVGLLNVSNQVASITGETIQGPISQASYPAFAKVAHDKVALLQQYCSSLAYVTLLALPTSVGIALVAPLVVPVCLGEKWLAAIPVIQVLALASVARAMTAASNPLYMALNRPRLVTIFATVRLFLLVPALTFATSRWGLIGAAWSVTLVPALLFPARQWVIARALSTKQTALMAPAVRPGLATLAMSVAFVYAESLVDFGESITGHVAELALLVIVGASAFALAISVHWKLCGCPKGPETDIASFMLKIFKRESIA